MNLFYKYFWLLLLVIFIIIFSFCEDIFDVLNYGGEDFYCFVSIVSSIVENLLDFVDIFVIFIFKVGVLVSGMI